MPRLLTVIALSLLLLTDSSVSFVTQTPGRPSSSARLEPRTRMHSIHADDKDDTAISQREEVTQVNHYEMDRRKALLSLATASTVLPFILSNPASAQTSDIKSLNDISLGEGQWTQASKFTMSSDNDMIVPASFATYASRFLIQYDDGVSSWWRNVVRKNSLLPNEQQQGSLGKAFGCLAMSVQLALNDYVRTGSSLVSAKSVKSQNGELANLFLTKYGTDRDARRQIGLLFALLPSDQQPTSVLAGLATTTALNDKSPGAAPPPSILTDDFAALLPSEYQCARIEESSNAFTIDPPITLYEVGVDEEFGQTATATPFGPLSSTPLKRDLPYYTPDIYAALGISGGVGCALTHTVVIPLDVVKTRAQTDPELSGGGGMLQGAVNIVQREGIQGLLLGAQATIAGFLWYGVSVYPSYAFFKRFLGQSLLPPEVATVHMNDVALIAGALASVIASLGLTPMEACRIRTVADPETYKPLGLSGTMRAISTEVPALGWRALYAGFPSLVTRQVIFGSVKFLAFERACEAIFQVWPSLHDATWTTLAVSLVAGGISGTLSSIVSQPADSVLTYVAQNSGEKLGVIQGCRVMVEREGVGSLFRGLGSRCVWAGSIIAGQFLLYDVFRTYFGVSGEDLSQVFQVVISRQ